MVVCRLGIVFVVLPSGNIVVCFEFADEITAHAATILKDSRVYATGSDGHCIEFEPPKDIRDDLKRYADAI